MAIKAFTEDKIHLDHGAGGAASSRLIQHIFLPHFGNSRVLEDAALIELDKNTQRLAFTTDSFVVQPLFFPGGDIGKLAITGTVNDLAVMGSIPRYISAGFILEEGLDISVLDRIAASMAKAASEAEVKIITGDTKVVRKGEADQIFINTSGIGFLPRSVKLSSANCRPGDVVIVSGTIGEHGIAIIQARENFGFASVDFQSDCQSIHDLAQIALELSPNLRCMRDPTRGGLATALVEITQASKVGITLYEKAIPIRSVVNSACQLLGLDPLYLACEGRMIAIAPASEAEAMLAAIRSHPKGKDALVIGEVVAEPKGVFLITEIGGKRPVLALEGAQFPRIC